MKKSYKFGEIILALREEYMECKHLIEELNKQVNVETENSRVYFSGKLRENYTSCEPRDRNIRLYVERRYNEILKKIQYLKYTWYSQYLYMAIFDVEKEENGLYGIKYADIPTPVDGRKYIPNVQIVNQERFSELVDEMFSTDLMQLKQWHYYTAEYGSPEYYECPMISLNFDRAKIIRTLFDNSSIWWDGISDEIEFSIDKYNKSFLIVDILSMEVPTDKIPEEWLKLLEKHERVFGNEVFFDVDTTIRARKVILQVAGINRNDTSSVVKLLRKEKRKRRPFKRDTRFKLK